MAIYRMLQVGDTYTLFCSPESNTYGDLSDIVATRTLGVGMGVVGQVDRESCTEACANAGYPLAGVEYAAECCELKTTFWQYMRNGD